VKGFLARQPAFAYYLRFILDSQVGSMSDTGPTSSYDFEFNFVFDWQPVATPEPPSLLLLGSGLAGLLRCARRVCGPSHEPSQLACAERAGSAEFCFSKSAVLLLVEPAEFPEAGNSALPVFWAFPPAGAADPAAFQDRSGKYRRF